MSTNVVEASGLGERYGSTWALRECTLAIPGGSPAAASTRPMPRPGSLSSASR
jgi:hypothetical protein